MTVQLSAGETGGRPARRPATRSTADWNGQGLWAERRFGYYFIAPVFGLLFAVIVYPLGQAFWISLHRTRGLNTTYVGLQNYARVLADDAFWNAFGVTFWFTFICVTLHMGLGLALAMLLNKLTVGRATLRVLFLTPWMIAPAIGATIWLWLLEPQFGVVNYILQATGIIDAPQIWLGAPRLAFGSIVAVDVWRGIPFVMLLMLAGLQTIPAEQYEAAALDGASGWQAFRHITLPNLRYLLIVATTLDIINTVRQFDIIAVLTGGGPVGSTEVLPALIYNTAFRANRFGEAAATGVLLLAVLLVFATIYFSITRPDRQAGDA